MKKPNKPSNIAEGLSLAAVMAERQRLADLKLMTAMVPLLPNHLDMMVIRGRVAVILA